jgi:HSP20 family protein
MTSLMRRNPFDEIAALWPRDLFNRDFFGALKPDGSLGVGWSPRCDISETDAEVIVHAELPGVAAEDMNVTVHDGTLTVSGEKRTETKKEDGNGYTERFFGSFERRLTIPANVDEERIEANLKDGILEVHMPKVAKAEPQPRKIEVRAAQ